jgi:hypothetical protein
VTVRSADVAIPEATDPQGCWGPKVNGGCWHGGRKDDGTRTATIQCPLCGQVASMSQHTIEADGTVNPSAVCPYSGCTFHEWIRLEGWKP